MIDVCVPIHNAIDYVVRCLESIKRNTLNFRLILHDDASEPHTTHWLQDFALAHEGPITFLRSPKQVWFTSSVNRCLAHVRNEWVAIINSDVEIQDPQWVQKFQAIYARDPQAGLCGATDSLYTDGALPYVDNGKIQGHLWVTRKDRLDQVGWLSEREPAEVHIRSDDAWSEKFRKAGFNNYYLTDIRHVHGGESHPGGGASWDRKLSKLPKWIDVVHNRAHGPFVLVEKP